MNKRDIKAKQSLVKATDSIRDKFRQVRSTHLENKRLLEEQYKPITKKLTKLIDFKDKKSKRVSLDPKVETETLFYQKPERIVIDPIDATPPSQQQLGSHFIPSQFLPNSSFSDIDFDSDDDIANIKKNNKKTFS